MRYILILALFCLFIGPTRGQVSLSQKKVDLLFSKGMELAEQGNAGAARSSFEQFLETADPQDLRRVEAEYQIVRATLRLRMRDAEVSALRFIDKRFSQPRAHEARFDLANYFYAIPNYTKAITHYAQLDFTLLSAEQQVQGKFQLGYSYFNDRQLTDALTWFNQVKSFEHSYTAASNYYAGFIEYSDGKYTDALRDLQKAETNEAYVTVVPYLIASTYYRLNQHDQLIAYAEKVRDNEAIKNRRELLLLTAEAQYAKGQFEKAAILYQESIGDPALGDAGVWYRAGVSCDKVGDQANAIRFLEMAAASKDPVSHVASYQLAIVYLQRGDKAYALNAFNYARKAVDTSIAEQAQFNYAKVLYDQGQSDKAILEFEYYLATFSSGSFGVETRELLAQAYVNGNNYNKALEYIETLPSKSPAVEQALQKAAFLKGAEHFNKNEYDEALALFRKSLEHPRDQKYVQRAAFWCAETMSMKKQYANAEAYYLQASRQQGDPALTTQALYGLGYAYYNQKKFSEALSTFSQFVSKNNRQTANYADGVLRLADCYYISKRFDDALSHYQQYKQAGGQDMDYAYLQLGLVYGIQKKYDNSRTQFNLLVSEFPQSEYRAEAMYQRAHFDIEQGAYKSAAEGLTQLIQLEPNSAYVPYALLRRAASYFNTKELGKTVDDYITLVKTYPSHPLAQEALLPLQEALEGQGRSAEFDQYLTLVKTTNPDSKGLENVEFETAKKLYFNEQYDKAIAALQSFVASYPASVFVPEANYYYAESYYRQRKLEQALPVYGELRALPAFTYAARVAGRLAEITFKLGRYEEAIAHYHYFEGFTSNKKDLYNALAGLMESFYLTAQYDSTDFYARQVLERAAINAGAENKASLFLGKSAMARGDYEAAEDEFLNTLNAARDEFGAEAKYQLATIFFLRKDYRQCHETLLSLNRDFKAYEFWVGKSFLLLADNYAAQDNVFQATATLQSLVDNFPLATIRDEAALKLKELAAKQTAATPADTTENR